MLSLYALVETHVAGHGAASISLIVVAANTTVHGMAYNIQISRLLQDKLLEVKVEDVPRHNALLVRFRPISAAGVLEGVPGVPFLILQA